MIPHHDHSAGWYHGIAEEGLEEMIERSAHARDHARIGGPGPAVATALEDTGLRFGGIR